MVVVQPSSLLCNSYRTFFPPKHCVAIDKLSVYKKWAVEAPSVWCNLNDASIVSKLCQVTCLGTLHLLQACISTHGYLPKQPKPGLDTLDCPTAGGTVQRNNWAILSHQDGEKEVVSRNSLAPHCFPLNLRDMAHGAKPSPVSVQKVRMVMCTSWKE